MSYRSRYTTSTTSGLSGYRSQPSSNRTSLYLDTSYNMTSSANLSDFDRQFRKLMERTDKFTNRVEKLQTTSTYTKGFRRLDTTVTGLRNQRDSIDTAFNHLDRRLNEDDQVTTEEEWRRFVTAGILIEKAVELLRHYYRSPKPVFEYSPPSRSPYSFNVSSNTSLVSMPGSPTDSEGIKLCLINPVPPVTNGNDKTPLEALTEQDEESISPVKKEALASVVKDTRDSSVTKDTYHVDKNSKNNEADTEKPAKAFMSNNLFRKHEEHAPSPTELRLAQRRNTRAEANKTNETKTDSVIRRKRSLFKTLNENVRPKSLYELSSDRSQPMSPENVSERNSLVLSSATHSQTNMVASPIESPSRKSNSSFHGYNSANRVPLRERLAKRQKEREAEEERKQEEEAKRKVSGLNASKNEESTSLKSRFLRRFRNNEAKTSETAEEPKQDGGRTRRTRKRSDTSPPDETKITTENSNAKSGRTSKTGVNTESKTVIHELIQKDREESEKTDQKNTTDNHSRVEQRRATEGNVRPLNKALRGTNKEIDNSHRVSSESIGGFRVRSDSSDSTYRRDSCMNRVLADTIDNRNSNTQINNTRPANKRESFDDDTTETNGTKSKDFQEGDEKLLSSTRFYGTFTAKRASSKEEPNEFDFERASRLVVEEKIAPIKKSEKDIVVSFESPQRSREEVSDEELQTIQVVDNDTIGNDFFDCLESILPRVEDEEAVSIVHNPVESRYSLHLELLDQLVDDRSVESINAEKLESITIDKQPKQMVVETPKLQRVISLDKTNAKKVNVKSIPHDPHRPVEKVEIKNLKQSGKEREISKILAEIDSSNTSLDSMMSEFDKINDEMYSSLLTLAKAPGAEIEPSKTEQKVSQLESKIYKNRASPSRSKSFSSNQSSKRYLQDIERPPIDPLSLSWNAPPTLKHTSMLDMKDEGFKTFAKYVGRDVAELTGETFSKEIKEKEKRRSLSSASGSIDLPNIQQKSPVQRKQPVSISDNNVSSHLLSAKQKQLTSRDESKLDRLIEEKNKKIGKFSAVKTAPAKKKLEPSEEQKMSTFEEQKMSTFEEQKMSTFEEQEMSTFEEQKMSTFEEQKISTFEEQKMSTFEEQKMSPFEEQKMSTFEEPLRNGEVEGKSTESLTVTLKFKETENSFEKSPLESPALKAEPASLLEKITSVEETQNTKAHLKSQHSIDSESIAKIVLDSTLEAVEQTPVESPPELNLLPYATVEMTIPAEVTEETIPNLTLEKSTLKIDENNKANDDAPPLNPFSLRLPHRPKSQQDQEDTGKLDPITNSEVKRSSVNLESVKIARVDLSSPLFHLPDTLKCDGSRNKLSSPDKTSKLKKINFNLNRSMPSLIEPLKTFNINLPFNKNLNTTLPKDYQKVHIKQAKSNSIEDGNITTNSNGKPVIVSETIEILESEKNPTLDNKLPFLEKIKVVENEDKVFDTIKLPAILLQETEKANQGKITDVPPLPQVGCIKVAEVLPHLDLNGVKHEPKDISENTVMSEELPTNIKSKEPISSEGSLDICAESLVGLIETPGIKKETPILEKLAMISTEEEEEPKVPSTRSSIEYKSSNESINNNTVQDENVVKIAAREIHQTSKISELFRAAETKVETCETTVGSPPGAVQNSVVEKEEQNNLGNPDQINKVIPTSPDCSVANNEPLFWQQKCQSKKSSISSDDEEQDRFSKMTKPVLGKQLSLKEYRRMKLERQRTTSDSSNISDDTLTRHSSSSSSEKSVQADISDVSEDLNKNRNKRYSHSRKDLRMLNSENSETESETTSDGSSDIIKSPDKTTT